jgi:hypothetical protein
MFQNINKKGVFAFVGYGHGKIGIKHQTKVVECKWGGIQQHKSSKVFPPLMVLIASKQLASSFLIIIPTHIGKFFCM